MHLLYNFEEALPRHLVNDMLTNAILSRFLASASVITAFLNRNTLATFAIMSQVHGVILAVSWRRAFRILWNADWKLISWFWTGDVENRPPTPQGPKKKQWWDEYVSEDNMEKLQISGKMSLLYTILQECDAIGDKV